MINPTSISGQRDIPGEWKQLNPNFILCPGVGDENKKDKIAHLGEVYSISPNGYNIDLLKQYKCVVTWNSKFYEAHKNELNIHLVKDFCLCHDMYREDIVLDSYKSYEEKINGICVVSNLKTFFDCNEGAIGYKRLQIMNGIQSLVKHVYGGLNCGEMYKGILGQRDPDHQYVNLHKYGYDKISKVNEYRFSLVCENSYHEFWSWDYITEKIWDVFSAKTVAVYYGCYNIEQRIPKELYIDYRDFSNDAELSDYLINFPRDRYIEMTEKAYDFYKQNEPTFLKELKELATNL